MMANSKEAVTMMTDSGKCHSEGKQQSSYQTMASSNRAVTAMANNRKAVTEISNKKLSQWWKIARKLSHHDG